MTATTAITPFNFNTHDVRVVIQDGNPWFVASDVCAILGVKNHRDSLMHLDDDEKGVVSNDTLGGKQQVSVVNESGLYALVLRSRKPEAKKFTKWVTSEVLPSIRKTGGYSYTTQPTDKLSAGQQDTLRSLLESHVKKLPLPAQGKAMMQGWSKLKAHFGVSYRDIPAHQFTEAVSILTRHVVDLTTQQPSIEPRVDINDGARMAAARDVAMEYLEKYRTAILAGKTRIDMEPVAPEVMEGLFAHALMSQRMLSHYDYTTGEMLTRIVPRDAVLVSFSRDDYFDIASHIPMQRIPEMLGQLSKRVETHLGAFAQRLHHEGGVAA